MSQPHTPREIELADSDLLVLMGDHAGRYVYANAAFLNIRNWKWSELKGTPTTKGNLDGNPKQVLADMTVSIRARKPWSGIYKNTCDNGDVYWSRINLSPLYTDGKYAGVLIVHSKPSREEIDRAAPLYERLKEPGGGGLAIRNGHVYRDTLRGRAVMRYRSLGLKFRVWSVAATAAVASMGTLAAVGTDAGWTSFGFLAGCALQMLTAGAVGIYLSRTIVDPLRDVISFANQIAAGDLSSQQRARRNDEIGDVMRALTQMNVSMRATVQDVREGVKQMKQATTEIAAGAQDLSHRTESQASNLQQTAASMEEMNATVRNNSDMARQASGAAEAASSAAETGGTAVNSVIQTMEGISRSSKQIADIIGVIDGIAFQTNILALNAAVEAARAGEQGRGFAVVAGEVRSLAQRSAQSAKEIRSLISESVTQVDNGFRSVSAAGKTIENVVQHARKLNDLVNHIADASNEQSSGIGQINQAVTDLDRMTQQNAALVEQSTALAHSLTEQSGRLVDAVQIFQLSQAEKTALYKSVDPNAALEARTRTAQGLGLQR